MLQATELKEVQSTLDKIITFFTTFGSLGGLSIIFFIFLILGGYKYLNFRLKQKEKQTEGFTKSKRKN